MTPSPEFKVTPLFDAEYPRNGWQHHVVVGRGARFAVTPVVIVIIITIIISLSD